MRRRVLAVALVAALITGRAALAQPAPTPPAKTIRIVAATSAGGITDFLARLVAERLSPLVGQPVVVENRAGATGNVAIEFVARAPADGATLLVVAGGNIVIAPFLYRSLPVDAMTELAPVFNIAEAPQLLVVPGSLPAKDLREFIALARSRPDTINYASAGIGSTTHLAADHFARLAGVRLVHVPYKGTGPALGDLIAGRVHMLSVGLEPVRSHLKSGALRALAVGSKKRLAAAPDIPTSAEAGLPGWEMTTWFGTFAPTGTDARVVEALNARLQSVIDDPRVRQRLVDSGIDPLGGSVREFAERVRADYRAWGEIVKASGVKID
jgi:tripartite-type tricarboxylate transporter receptor subunit TctC